jgi:hypothetical protein
LEIANRNDLAIGLKRNLLLYEHRQPSLAPWNDDDPIFCPKPGKMMLSVPNEGVPTVK